MIISECRRTRPKLCQNNVKGAAYVHGEFGACIICFVQGAFFLKNVTTPHKRLVLVELLRSRRTGALSNSMGFLTELGERRVGNESTCTRIGAVSNKFTFFTNALKCETVRM